MAMLMKLMDDLEHTASNLFYDLEPEIEYVPIRFHRKRYSPYTLPSVSKWARLSDGRRGGGFGKLCGVGKDGFKATLDVSQFKPEELNVKVVDDWVVVEGNHEEREDDHGTISRHFKRRYKLPKDFDPDKVQSALSTDGVLTITAPNPKPIEGESKERIVQIQQTSEPALTNGVECTNGAEEHGEKQTAALNKDDKKTRGKK